MIASVGITTPRIAQCRRRFLDRRPRWSTMTKIVPITTAPTATASMIKSTGVSRKNFTPNEKGRNALRTAARPGKLPVSAMIILQPRLRSKLPQRC